MMERRLHLLLDEARYERVAARAARQGVSVAAVIREVIDRGLPAVDDHRRAMALRRILDADPMPVPEDPADLRAEIDAGRERRT